MGSLSKKLRKLSSIRFLSKSSRSLGSSSGDENQSSGNAMIDDGSSRGCWSEPATFPHHNAVAGKRQRDRVVLSHFTMTKTKVSRETKAAIGPSRLEEIIKTCKRYYDEMYLLRTPTKTRAVVELKIMPYLEAMNQELMDQGIWYYFHVDSFYESIASNYPTYCVEISPLRTRRFEDLEDHLLLSDCWSEADPVLSSPKSKQIPPLRSF